MKELIQVWSAAARQASTALQQVSQLADGANSLIGSEGTRALGSTERAMTSLTAASNTIDQVLTDNRNALGTGMQGLAELGPVLQELRDTLVSIKRITRRLEDNPANYLMGREKIQELEPE